MVRYLLAVVGLLLSAGAWAQASATWNTSRAIVTAPIGTSSGAMVPGSDFSRLIGAPARTIDSGAGAGSAAFRDLLDKPFRPANTPGAMAATRQVPWSAVAKAAAKAAPVISTAVAVKEVWDLIRCKEDGGQAVCDAGAPEATFGDPYYFRDANTGPFGSVTAAAMHGSCTADTICSAPTVGTSYSNGSQTVYWNGNPPGETFPTSIRTPVSWSYTVYGGDPRRVLTTGTATVHAITVTKTTIRCPSIMVNGQPFTPTKGVDDKCPTGVYGPILEPALADKIETYGDKSKAVPMATELDGANIPMDATPPVFEAIPPSPLPRETRQNADGSTTVTDKYIGIVPKSIPLPNSSINWPSSAGPQPPSLPGYDARETIKETTYPPGASIPPQPPTPTTNPGDPPSTVTDQPASTADIITCGLPWTPPCKIDETGTPQDQLPDPAETVSDARQPFDTCIADLSACLPSLPSLAWNFALPTGCGAIPLPAFAPFIESVDICQFQPVFHDLMSVVWALGGLFGAISIFWRQTFSGG